MLPPVAATPMRPAGNFLKKSRLMAVPRKCGVAPAGAGPTVTPSRAFAGENVARAREPTQAAKGTRARAPGRMQAAKAGKPAGEFLTRAYVSKFVSLKYRGVL